jgi:APA family basic amino acid/polyamine antiporter
MEVLKRKYGLLTAIAMVVGIVIGSGVFFKADNVLSNTNGNLGLSLFAWLIGGLIMVFTAYCFSLMAGRFSKINGIVDYVEVSSNKVVGYGMGWYMAAIYYPVLVSILAFVSANYLFTLFNVDANGYIWVVTFLLVVLSFILNILAPRIAGHYQVGTTFIKMIPIFGIAIIGTLYGLFTGGTVTGFGQLAVSNGEKIVSNNFSTAVLATAFAYDGWSVATAINAELKDSKRTLPKALVIGSLIVIISYLLYYVGLSSTISNQTIINDGDKAPIVAFAKLFGDFGGVLFNVFIVISCLGTLNGLTLGCIRGTYALAIRNRGPKPQLFSKLDHFSNTPVYSGLLGFIFTLFFLLLWYLAIQKGLLPGNMDELAIALIYTSYLFVFVWMIINFKESNPVQRFVMPILGILGAFFLILSATGILPFLTTLFGEGKLNFSGIISFLKFFAIIFPLMAVGMFFYKKQDEEISSKLEEEN